MPVVVALEAWLCEERRKLSRHGEVAGSIDYMLKRWAAFSFLDDGRICLTNNAAERALRGRALGARPSCSPAPIAAASVPPSCTA